MAKKNKNDETEALDDGIKITRSTESEDEENEKKPKKKRSKCCTCLIAFFVVSLVLFAGAFATGWIIGDKYTKEYLDMSMGEVMGVYFDLRIVSKSSMDLTEFSDADADSFENALKDALFIKRGTELPLDELSDELLGGLFGTDGGGDKPADGGETVEGVSDTPEIPAIRNTLLMEALRDYGVVTNENEEASEDNVFIRALSEILTYENMDLERLENYNGEPVGFNFTDKQIAAFVNRMFKRQIEKIDDGGETLSVNGALKFASLAQVKFSGSAETPVIRLTLRLNTAQYITEMLKELTGGWNLGFLSWIFAPKYTYASVDLSLGETPKMTFQLNALNAEKRARFNKLLSKIGDGGINIDADFLDPVTNDTITPMVDDIKETLNFDNVNTGKIGLDPFGLAIKYSGINENAAEGEEVTSKDLVNTLKHFLTSSEVTDENAAFTDQYLNSETGKTEYMPVNFSDPKYTLVDYQNELMDELKKKYLLKAESFDEIAELFGIGGDGGSQDPMDFADKVDSSKIVQLAKQDGTNRGLVLTDRMVGALFASAIPDIMEGADTFNDYEPRVEFVSLQKTEVESVTHNVLKAAFSLDVASAFDAIEGFGNIIKGLLPSTRLSITVEFDITPGLLDGEYLEGRIYYNDLTAEETDDILNLLEKLGIDFSVSDILAQVEDQFRPVIDTMFDLLPGVTLGESKTVSAADYNDGYFISSGSIFALLAKQITDMPNANGEIITEENVIDLVLAMGDIDEDELLIDGVSENYDGFVSEAEDKYYFKDGVLDDANGNADFDTLIDAFSDFSYEDMNIAGENGDKADSLAYDGRAIAELWPFMRDTEFGAILNAEISGRAGEFNNIEGFTEIDGIRLTPQITDANGLGTDNDGYLTIVIRVDNSVFLEAESVKYLSMLPNDIFFTLTFDVSESGAVLQDGYTGDESIVKYYYPSALKINNMYVPAETDDPSDPLFKDYENFSRILTVVNGGENPFDVSGVQYDFGCAIWEHFDKVRDAIGENNLKFTAKDSDNDPDVIDIEYGFLFGSVYDFLADTHEDDLTAENIKAGIQGMYPYDDACPNPNNYDYDLLVPDGEQLLDPAPALELGRTYDDNEFGAILKDGSELGLSGDNNPFSGGKYEIIRFSVATDETVPTLTHLAITLKMNVERNTDDFGDFRDGFWGFMPEEVYFTIYVDFDGLDYSASSDAYKLNLLTQAAEEELLEVTGFNMGANSNLLEAQTDAVVDLLNNTMVDLGGADIYLFKLLTYADGTVTMPGF